MSAFLAAAILIIVPIVFIGVVFALIALQDMRR